MASTFLHAPSGRWLTSLGPDAKPGDDVLLSFGSFAYNRPMGAGGFGFSGCQFTRYTLAQPVAVDDGGQPLFDLDECSPRSPLDGSPQAGRKGAWDYEYRTQVLDVAPRVIAAFAAAALRPPVRLMRVSSTGESNGVARHTYLVTAADCRACDFTTWTGGDCRADMVSSFGGTAWPHDFPQVFQPLPASAAQGSNRFLIVAPLPA